VRVVFVISSLRHGGAERMLVNLVNGLPSYVLPHVVVLKSETAMAVHMDNPRAQLHVLNMRSRIAPLAWWRLLRLLRHVRPDIVHSHMTLANLMTRLVKASSGCTVLVNHEHGLGCWKRGWLCLLDRHTQSLADRIITVSEVSRQLRLRREGIIAVKAIMIHNAVDCSEWASLRRRAQTPVPHWGVAASLTPVKRVHLCLELLAAAKARGCEAHLVIAGDGPERTRLATRSDRLGVSDRVKFLGCIADMRNFYRNVDVLLLTSAREDCPMVLLEALAAGKFIVAARVGGVPEILDSVTDKLLITDASDLSAVAASISGIPAGFDSEANRRAANRYDMGAYIKRLLSLYEELLKVQERRKR